MQLVTLSFGRHLDTTKEVTDSQAKTLALACIMERLVPEPWGEVRRNEKELRENGVLEIPVREASARIRRELSLHSVRPSCTQGGATETAAESSWNSRHMPFNVFIGVFSPIGRRG